MTLLSAKSFLEMQESYYSVTELTRSGVTHDFDFLYCCKSRYVSKTKTKADRVH